LVLRILKFLRLNVVLKQIPLKVNVNTIAKIVNMNNCLVKVSQINKCQKFALRSFVNFEQEPLLR